MTQYTLICRFQHTQVWWCSFYHICTQQYRKYMHRKCTDKRVYSTNEWTQSQPSDQVDHLWPGTWFFIQNGEYWFLYPCLFVSQSVMTGSLPLVNVPVAYVAFKWGGINLSNDLTAQSSSMDMGMYSGLWCSLWMQHERVRGAALSYESTALLCFSEVHRLSQLII